MFPFQPAESHQQIASSIRTGDFTFDTFLKKLKISVQKSDQRG